MNEKHICKQQQSHLVRRIWIKEYIYIYSGWSKIGHNVIFCDSVTSNHGENYAYITMNYRWTCKALILWPKLKRFYFRNNRWFQICKSGVVTYLKKNAFHYPSSQNWVFQSILPQWVKNQSELNIQHPVQGPANISGIFCLKIQHSGESHQVYYNLSHLTLSRVSLENHGHMMSSYFKEAMTKRMTRTNTSLNFLGNSIFMGHYCLVKNK